MRGGPLGKGHWSKLRQRMHVDLPLEIDDLTDRIPEIDPPPLIEFGLGGPAEIERRVRSSQTEQEPPLLLTDDHGPAVTTHVFRGKPVVHPTGRLANEIDILRREPDLFIQLAIRGFCEGLARANSALRELPAPAAYLPPEKYLALAMHQNDADVCAKAFGVDDIAHGPTEVCHNPLQMLKHAVLETSRWKSAAGLLLLAAVVCIASLLIGSSGIGAGRAFEALLGIGDEAARSVMMGVRLPRLLAALGVGGLLALAGVLLQALFRNPLADPYVLGVSGGAAVGAILAMMAGAAALGVQSSAIGGAVAAVVVVYMLARGGGSPRLLLTGVVMASACGALVSVLLAMSEASRLPGMVFWLAGDLGWSLSPWSSALTAVFAGIVAVLVARPLNVLAAGELRARGVGLNIEAWRTVLFIACATLTALAVISAGTVGFVGLITPHAVRLSFRTSDHRIVAPASVVLGGTLLATADLVARTVASPRQLPVGAIMALVGAPIFIALLRGRGGTGRLL